MQKIVVRCRILKFKYHANFALFRCSDNPRSKDSYLECILQFKNNVCTISFPIEIGKVFLVMSRKL